MLRRYVAVLRAPGGARLFGGLACVRLGMAANTLLILLFARHELGSFTAAGAITGAYTVGLGVSSPFLGRLADRRGQATVILPSTALFAAGMTGLIAAGTARAPAGVIALLAFATGAATPPVSAFARSLIGELVAGDDAATRSGYALDAIIIEIGFTAGPPIGAGFIALASAQVGLVVFAIVIVGGALLFATTPQSQARAGSDSHEFTRSPLRERGLQTLVTSAMCIGAGFGALEVTMPAFAGMHGSRATGGILLAFTSLASGIGGVLYGGRKHGRWSLRREYLTLIFVLPATFALILAATSMVVMGVFAFISGLAIAPLISTQNELVNEISPQVSITEAYTWVGLGITVGVAIGDLIAGTLVDASGWRAGIGAGTGLLLCASIVSILRRQSLIPPSVAAVGR